MFKISNKIGNKKGTLIVFEGISGCGKSAKIKGLTRYLQHNGFAQPVIIEWNSNRILRSLVAFLNKYGLLNAGIYSLIQWISFLIDYLIRILPALCTGKSVIADRYIYTGIVRDWINGGFSMMGKIVAALVTKPDLICFCEADPRTCYQRIKNRKKALFYMNKRITNSKYLKNKDLYYLKKMWYAYLSLIKDISIKTDITVMTVNCEDKYRSIYIRETLKERSLVTAGK